MSNVGDALGNYGNQQGKRTEMDFVNALNEHRAVGDIPIRETIMGDPKKNGFQYDLIAFGDKKVLVGEVKTRMGEADVITFAEERLPHFVQDFPDYKSHKIYGMVCALSFTSDACEAAKRRHLFVIRLKSRMLRVGNADKAQPVAQG